MKLPRSILALYFSSVSPPSPPPTRHSAASSTAKTSSAGTAIRDSGAWRTALVGQTTADNKAPHNTFLIYRGGEFANFDMRYKFKCEGFNSGMQYRSIDEDEKNFRRSGLIGLQLHAGPPMRIDVKHVPIRELN